MSYVVQVWQQPLPLPQDLSEAVGLRDALGRQRAGPCAAFAEFARRLTERHPCIADGNNDNDDAASDVWTDGPLDGRSRSAVYAIGINVEHLDAVLPFVVEVAGQLGLALLDEQAGAVYLPDGSALTPRGRGAVQRIAPAPPGEDLQSRQQVIDALQATLAPVLAPHGFKTLKRWSDLHAPHKRRCRACDQFLAFDIEHAGAKGYDAAPCFVFEPKLPASMRQALGLASWDNVNLFVDFVDAARHAGVPVLAGSAGRNHKQRLYTMTQAREWAHEVGVFTLAAIVPIADRCDDFAGIDQVVNAPGAQSNVLKINWPDRLLFAQLAANPRYSELVAEGRAGVAPGFAAQKFEERVAALQSL